MDKRLFTRLQNKIAHVNFCAPEDDPVRIFGNKLVVYPGFDEVPTLGNLVCS